MPKLPAIQLYTGDWLKDPKLSMCSPATRGLWIDAICAMHESDRSGTLSGTADQLARVLRCSPSDVQSAWRELQTTGAADVTERNGLVTLNNRRMRREHKEREQERLRQARHRGSPAVTPTSRQDHKKVTPSSSSSSSNTPPNPPAAGPPGFEKFWTTYPECERKVDRDGILKKWESRGLEESTDEIMAGLERWKKSDGWRRGFIPLVSTWINQRRWTALNGTPELVGGYTPVKGFK